MPECELENMGLVEAVMEAGPSTLEYQTLSAEASVVNGEAVTGMSLIFFKQVLLIVLLFHHSKTTVFMPVHQH